jgi:uncharacterized heparinase superfamily protein
VAPGAGEAPGVPGAGEAPAVPNTQAEGRLLRVGGDRGLSLSERVTARVNASLYKTPLHRLRLRGRFPLKLLGVPRDPVAGDPAIGERIVAGRLIHAGHIAMTRNIDFGAGLHPPAWREWADGWDWLRDLAAHVPDRTAAAAIAEPLVARWLARFGEFDPAAWRPDATGRRLLFAFGYAPLILSSTDQVYRSALLAGLATWARHLDRAAFRMPDTLAKAEALAGLYAAGVLLPGDEARAAAALAALEKLLGVLVAPDGGIASRAPVDALALAQLLIFAASCSEAISARSPPLFADTLARLVPSLRGLALGDGMIGGWHGGAALPPAPLAALAKQAATGTALSRAGRWSGYQRLSAGKTVLVVDAGPPPVARVATGGHAGTLAFEMSDGNERLITNCGGARGLQQPMLAELAAGLRTTAAHSTLIIADTNSTRIRPDRADAPGPLGLGVEEVTVQLRSSEQGHWLEAGHDGYAKRFGMIVERRLFLSPDGQDLRGEDAIVAVPRNVLQRRSERNFAIRFHLGPGVAATPTADGTGALLKLPAGRVWAMKTRGGQVAIEPSLWVDPQGQMHKTQQLIIAGRTHMGAASIGWSFKRAGK